MKQINKNYHKFLLLWAGELISAVGSGLTSFGLSVFVFAQTGKAADMALVSLLAFLPALLLSPVAGVLADRFDRRLLMILGDGLSALGLVFILVCMLLGNLQLWQICVGVTVSSVFSSLLEPAYKSTITDLLTKEEYTKASGLVSVAGSAKYLISPVLAGFLLSFSDITLLLILDICTFFITVAATLVVRKGITPQKVERKSSFFLDLKEGWTAISQNKGVLMIIFASFAITLFLGFIQTLCAPMLLAFTDSVTLGTVETLCASGMLVSSLIIGMAAIRKWHVKLLSCSLFLAGICMVFFGMLENLLMICISGFLFFAMIPFADMSLDYLVRTNIENKYQGRAWGLIGIISQMGYVISYACSGLLADSIGREFQIGVGRGSGILILISGILLSLCAVVLYFIKSVRRLEKQQKAVV